MQNENSNNPENTPAYGPPGSLPPGTHVGKYEIKQVLGAGAQSIVYLGYDRLLDRPVAIKQISASLLADARFLKRFRSEAKILAQLGSEGASIVSVYDLIENENGMFIAMEYVNGRTLRDILAYQKFALPLDIAGKILLAVGRGLAVAHQAQIVHRDVKPGNIMVTRGFEARIMDFGVAARAGEDDSLSLGTTKYMAPEVFKGQSVDIRADIYSLGIMAYEMLTGREYFDKLFAEITADRKTENLRWMKWHCDESKQAPALNEINLLISPDVGKVVARMMAKDPAERYSSMEALLADLEKAIALNAENAGSESSADASGPQVVSARLDDSNMGLLAEAAADFDDDAPTGKLPLSPAQSKRKLVAVIVIVAVLLLGGISVGVKLGLDHKRRVSQASMFIDDCRKNISDASLAYRSGEVEHSLELFEKSQDMLSEFADKYSDLGQNSRLREALDLFCRANIAMISGDSSAADTLLVQVEKIGALPQEDISVFKERLTVRSDTLMYLEKLTEALADGDFQQARQMRAHYDDIKQPPLDIDRKAAVVFARMDNLIRKSDFDRAVVAGDKAMELANRIITRDDLDLFDQAAVYLDEAASQYRKAMGLDAGDSMDRKLLGVENATAFMNARKEYLQAGEKASLDARIDMLKKIVDSRPPDQDTLDLYNSVLSERSLQLAQTLIDSDVYEDMQNARDYLAEAYRLSAKEQTKIALDRMDRKIQRHQLIEKARMLGQQKLFAEQLEVLMEISAMGSDPELELQIEQAKIDMYLQQGEQARSENDWSLAQQCYEMARRVRINDSTLALRVDKLNEYLQAQKKYFELIAQGDELLAQAEYPRAIRKFLRAIETGHGLGMETAEVQDKLGTARYHNEVEKGKRFLEQGHPELALPLFNTAKKYNDTEEVHDLIRQALKMEFEQKQRELDQ